MKKMNRKITAMLAAVMTMSAMGAMNAFAIETNHYAEGGTSQSAEVDLQAKVSAGTTTETPGSVDSSKDDTDKHIWNVTISADTLQWNLVKNDTVTYTQTLTWDPVNHVYTYARNDDWSNDSTESTYTVADTDTASKIVNVKNDSNFEITSTTVTASPSTGNSYSAGFDVQDPESSIAIGGNENTTITIDTSDMEDFYSNDYVTIGKATITLTAVDGTIAEANYTPSAVGG